MNFWLRLQRKASSNVAMAFSFPQEPACFFVHTGFPHSFDLCCYFLRVRRPNFFPSFQPLDPRPASAFTQIHKLPIASMLSLLVSLLVCPWPAILLALLKPLLLDRWQSLMLHQSYIWVLTSQIQPIHLNLQIQFLVLFFHYYISNNVFVINQLRIINSPAPKVLYRGWKSSNVSNMVMWRVVAVFACTLVVPLEFDFVNFILVFSQYHSIPSYPVDWPEHL